MPETFAQQNDRPISKRPRWFLGTQESDVIKRREARLVLLCSWEASRPVLNFFRRSSMAPSSGAFDSAVLASCLRNRSTGQVWPAGKFECLTLEAI